MKLKMNYKTRDNYKEIVKYIRTFIKNNEEVIIVNIGTDRYIGDSIAPIVGTMLKENNCNIKVFGTIEDPIHALNITEKLNKIKEEYPNTKIIGIDACLGDKEQIGEIQVRDWAIRPGKSVGKTLPEVGDISIIGIIDSDENNFFGESNNIRLDTVYKLSSLIANVILDATESLTSNIKFYNREIHNNKNNKKIEKEIAIN